MYNLLCPSCGLDKDILTTYETYLQHNTAETAILCPHCSNTTAFYSLTHLKENLRFIDKEVLNFYGPGTQERWYRGFNDLGKR